MSQLRLSVSALWGPSRDTQVSLNLEAFGTVTYQSLILERSHLQTNKRKSRRKSDFYRDSLYPQPLRDRTFSEQRGGV